MFSRSSTRLLTPIRPTLLNLHPASPTPLQTLLRRSTSTTHHGSTPHPLISTVVHARSPHTTSNSSHPPPESQLLASQRLNRPLAPHLSIYQPQLTWYMSGFNRVTGLILSGTYYLYLLGYAAGITPDIATIAGAVAGLPLIVKGVLKGFYVSVFMYHNWNGLRHIMWDFGRGLELPMVYRTGWAALAATGVSVVYFLFFV